MFTYLRLRIQNIHIHICISMFSMCMPWTKCMSRFNWFLFNHAPSRGCGKAVVTLEENGVKKDAGNYWEWVLWFIVIVIFKKALHSFNPLTWWSKNAQTTVVAKWGWMPTFLVSLDSSPLYSEFLVRKLQMVDSSCCCSELMLSDAPNMDRTK